MSDKKLGIMYIMISAFCFSLMSLFIRLSGDLPTMQKCFFRNAVAMVIAFFTLLKSKKSFKPGKGNVKYLLIRATAGGLGMVCNFYAIDHMAISDASILNKLSPFFAIIFSTLFLKEYANRFEWGAVIVAFIGALLVVKPSFSLEVIPAAAGVLGGCGAGLAYTFLRKLGKRGENGMIIVLFFSAYTTFLTLPFMIINYKPMTTAEFLCLLATGAAAAGGQVFITKAYQKAPAKEISVFDFSNVIFTALLGFVFLEQIPDGLSIAGYLIIIGTAVVKWYYSMRNEAKDKTTE